MSYLNNFLFLKLLLICVKFSHGYDVCTSNQTKILDTLNGKVLGECYRIPVHYSSTLTVTTNVLTWSSIPFAEPPINENRFKAPVPIQNWSGVRNGVLAPKACLQSYVRDSSEDCLYINIATKEFNYLNKDKELKPILVFIYGGSYTSGASTDYDPNIIVAAQDIIVVTFNYRLDALGFLYISSEETVTGNQGLLDQNLALKWVYENAARFGGDNQKITISGESAGAWSVGYHLFMPISWPYFRNAIMQSGGPTGINNGYLLLTSDEATSRSKIFFRLTGCNSNSTSQSLKCLKQLNSSQIVTAYGLLENYMTYNQSKFETEIYLPVIDNVVFNKSLVQLANENAFKQCNIITGYNSDEFGLFLLYAYNILGNQSSEYLTEAQSFNYTKFVNGLNKVFKYYPIYPYLSNQNLIRSIVRAYLSNSERQNTTSVNFVKKLNHIVSDFQYVCQAYNMAELYTRQNIVYMYNFKYRLSTTNIPQDLIEYLGVATHGDELYATFGNILSDYTDNYYDITDSERNFTQDILVYWTNFVKYDNPNGRISSGLTEWEPFFNNSSNSFELKDLTYAGKTFLFKKDGYEMLTGYSEHRCNFWNFTTKFNTNATEANRANGLYVMIMAVLYFFFQLKFIHLIL